MNNQRIDLKTIIEIALFAAIGYVLDELQGAVAVSFPSGGSIGFAMIAVLIIGYRRGLLPAIFTGLIMGLLDMTSKAYVLHPVQVLCDYVLPYALVGLGAGVFFYQFRKSDVKKDKIFYIILGTVAGGLLKLVSHYIAGVIWWGNPEYFAWGLNYMSPYLYALIYNIAFIGPSIVLCAGLLIVLFVKAPVIFTPNSTIKSEEGEKSKTDYIISGIIIAASLFVFVFYLVKYINSFYYKASSQKYYFDDNCMLISLSGLLGVGLGINLLVNAFKNKFKYIHINLGIGFINLVQTAFTLSKILKMYLDEDTIINNYYWLWFSIVTVLLIASITIQIIYIRKKKTTSEE